MPAHQQQYLGRLAFNSAEEALRSSSADSLKQSGRSPLIAAAAAATKLLSVCVLKMPSDHQFLKYSGQPGTKSLQSPFFFVHSDI